MNNPNNDPQQNETALTVSSLNHKELQAVQMRYMGNTSLEIAETTGYEESYVRRLFMRGGRLEKAYNDYSIEKRGETQAVANGVLELAKIEAKHAIERVIELSKNPFNAPTCFKANEYLLSLIGLSQNDPLRAMFKGLGFDDARKKIDELFKDVFEMSLDAKKRGVVFVTHSAKCINCGHENTPRSHARENDGTPPNP